MCISIVLYNSVFKKNKIWERKHIEKKKRDSEIHYWKHRNWLSWLRLWKRLWVAYIHSFLVLLTVRLSVVIHYKKHWRCAKINVEIIEIFGGGLGSWERGGGGACVCLLVGYSGGLCNWDHMLIRWGHLPIFFNIKI